MHLDRAESRPRRGRLLPQRQGQRGRAWEELAGATAKCPRAALLSVLLSCTPKAPDTGTPPDTAPVDTGTPALPTVTLLAPADGSTLFLGVRYDLVATFTGAETATAVVSGATSACDPPQDGVLHCSFLATTAGVAEARVQAEGPGGPAEDVALLTARQAEGVVPRGERFALGMYEVMDQAWFAPVAAAGIPLAQSYGTGGYTQEQWQDWAAEAGMLTMTRTSWSWSDPWGEPSSDEVLAELATRPEIAWWELPDNAVEDGSWAEETAALVSRIRVWDDRPAFLYLWTTIDPAQIPAYLPSVEVIAPGTYPEHACQPQPWIRWRIASAVDAVQTAGYTPEERPVVGTADLYGVPDAGCVAAELEQVRMNPLAMMAAGARGVLYFAWYHAVHSLDPAWGESALQTADLIMGESGLGYAVIHGEPRGDCAVTVTSGPEWSEAFTPAHTSTPIQYPSLHAAAWDWAGTRFVVAVNYTADPVTASIAGFPSQTPGVEVVGEGRSLMPEGGQVEDAFDRWGAHVYRAPIVQD